MTRPTDFNPYVPSRTGLDDGLDDGYSARPSTADDELAEQYAYARGGGFSDPRWARLATQQEAAAKANDRAAARLRSLATVLEAGQDAVGDDRITRRDFEDVMGAGAASVENLRRAAKRYEQGSYVLRDQQTYTAEGMSKKKFIKNGGSADALMGVPSRDRRQMWVNMDHDAFRNDKKLRWALTHEAFHSYKMRLKDQSDGHGQSAYRFGKDGGPTYLYRRLGSDEALVNPDKLTSFAQEK